MSEPSDRWRKTLAALWEQQSQWSSAADTYKGDLRSWNGPLILVGFIGVVLSTVTVYLVPQTTKPDQWTSWQFALAVVGPVLVAVAALLTREILGPKTEQQWIKARKVSEALKAEGWIFAAGAPPYSDPDTAPELLATKMIELKSGAEGLGPLPPPRTPRDPRPQTRLTPQQYVDQRVLTQCTFHDDDARKNVKTLARWRAVAVVLMVVSAVLGIIAGFGKQASINVWVAVVSTALATVTAYVTASRFEFLAASYAATSERLRNLATKWGAKQNLTPTENDRFILDCEAVLAAQNRTWADELSKSVVDRLNAQPQAASPAVASPPAVQPLAAQPAAAQPEAAPPAAAQPAAAQPAAEPPAAEPPAAEPPAAEPPAAAQPEAAPPAVAPPPAAPPPAASPPGAPPSGPAGG
jgi:conflict system pore-forming effector with SLATT domain/uncharacterized protein DUF4231